MHYVVTKRQASAFVGVGIVVCILSIVTSVSALWAGAEWRKERRSREAAIVMADRLLAQANQLLGDRQ